MPIPVIGLHNEHKVFVNGSCALNEERFMLIGSFVAFFIPLVIMVVTYCLTIQVHFIRVCVVVLVSPAQRAPVVMSLLYFLFLLSRCYRGRPQSSCTRQRLLPSSLCTHQQCQIHCSLHPAPSIFLRSIHLLLQTHKVNTHKKFNTVLCQQENHPLTFNQ